MTRYSVQVYKEGLRSDNYAVETAAEVFSIIKGWHNAYPITIELIRHEVEQECDICSPSSIIETICLKPISYQIRRKNI